MKVKKLFCVCFLHFLSQIYELGLDVHYCFFKSQPDPKTPHSCVLKKQTQGLCWLYFPEKPYSNRCTIVNSIGALARYLRNRCTPIRDRKLRITYVSPQELTCLITVVLQQITVVLVDHQTPQTRVFICFDPTLNRRLNSTRVQTVKHSGVFMMPRRGTGVVSTQLQLSCPNFCPCCLHLS